MVREVKRTDLGTKGQRRCLKACWLVDQCCCLLQLFPLFSVGVFLLSFTSAIFVPLSLSLSLSLYWFSALSFSLFCRFYMQKIKAKIKRQSLLVYGFSSLFHFSCAFSLLFSSSVLFSVFSLSPSLVTEMDEDNGTAASAHIRWSLLLGQ